MTDEELQAIEDLWKGATEGPWKAVQIPGAGAMRWIVSESPKAAWHKIVAILTNPGDFDADTAMAAARTTVPKLCAEVRRLKQLLEARDSNGKDR